MMKFTVSMKIPRKDIHDRCENIQNAYTMSHLKQLRLQSTRT